MPTKLRIAIMSDLHAAPKGTTAGGEVKLFSDDAGMANTAHPMKGLHALIKARNLQADFVLCPGDMTNKASSEALNYVWQSLHEVRDLMKARGVLATVGNHDVDSRTHADDAFPREALMRLCPPFPSGDFDQSNKYWAHGYYIQDFKISASICARFLVVNSCWLHEARDELHRGVLTTYTLDQIKSELAALPTAHINVAICHHHPAN
jgi:Calcineurin-like phosphoesterase